MIQSIIVGLFFVAAALYLVRILYRSFTVKSCESGCGKCNALDLNEIEKSIRSREILVP